MFVWQAGGPERISDTEKTSASVMQSDAQVHPRSLPLCEWVLPKESSHI